LRNVDTAPIYKAARNLHGKIDRWQYLEFRPPIYARITLGAREAGSELPFGTPTHVVLNSFTPETERTTHYFWSTVRSWGLDDADVSKIYKDMTDLAFAEDRAHGGGATGADRQRSVGRAAREPRISTAPPSAPVASSPASSRKSRCPHRRHPGHRHSAPRSAEAGALA